MPDRIDVAALNAVTEEGVADIMRNILDKFEKLGVADHPDMTCVPSFRAYLRRYDAALAASSVQAVRPSAPHLRLVG